MSDFRHRDDGQLVPAPRGILVLQFVLALRNVQFILALCANVDCKAQNLHQTSPQHGSSPAILVIKGNRLTRLCRSFQELVRSHSIGRQRKECCWASSLLKSLPGTRGVRAPSRDFRSSNLLVDGATSGVCTEKTVPVSKAIGRFRSSVQPLAARTRLRCPQQHQASRGGSPTASCKTVLFQAAKHRIGGDSIFGGLAFLPQWRYAPAAGDHSFMARGSFT